MTEYYEKAFISIDLALISAKSMGGVWDFHGIMLQPRFNLVRIRNAEVPLSIYEYRVSGFGLIV